MRRRFGDQTRARCLRPLVSLLAALVLEAFSAGPSAASCNQIPGTSNTFRGWLGKSGSAVRGAGRFVAVDLSAKCDGVRADFKPRRRSRRVGSSSRRRWARATWSYWRLIATKSADLEAATDGPMATATCVGTAQPGLPSRDRRARRGAASALSLPRHRRPARARRRRPDLHRPRHDRGHRRRSSAAVRARQPGVRSDRRPAGLRRRALRAENGSCNAEPDAPSATSPPCRRRTTTRRCAPTRRRRAPA